MLIENRMTFFLYLSPSQLKQKQAEITLLTLRRYAAPNQLLFSRQFHWHTVLFLLYNKRRHLRTPYCHQRIKISRMSMKAFWDSMISNQKLDLEIIDPNIVQINNQTDKLTYQKTKGLYCLLPADKETTGYAGHTHSYIQWCSSLQYVGNVT